VEQAAEAIPAVDARHALPAMDGWWLRERRVLRERAVRPMFVVMGRVGAKRSFQVFASEDEQPVETLAAHAANPPFGMCLRLRRASWGADDLDSFGAKDLIKSAGELAVTVANEEAYGCLLVAERHDKVPGLLHDPSAVGMGRDAGEIHASAVELDEEQHVQSPQPHGLHGEEVAGDDAGRLSAEKLRPAHARPSRRWLDAVATKDCPNRARRHHEAETGELALDPPITPRWVLRGQTEDQLAQLARDRRTARAGAASVGPAPANELLVPAQECPRPEDE
jgi:hypothetical protein